MFDKFGCAPARRFDGAARSLPTPAQCGVRSSLRATRNAPLVGIPLPQAILSRSNPPTNPCGLSFEKPQGDAAG